MQKSKPIVILILFSLLLPLAAHAQWGRQRELKDVSEARGLALNNTLLPVITGVGMVYLFGNETVRTIGASLAVYGLVMGPSSGNFYAEDYLRGTLGVVTRIGTGYMMLNATRELMGDKMADALGWDNERVSLNDTKILVGSGIFLVSMVYNILSAKASVEEYNASLGYTLNFSSLRVGDQVIPAVTASISF